MNTVLLSNLFSLPRIVYAMAEDGLFFQIFSRVHPRTQVPVVGIVVFGLLMALLALVFDLEALVQFLSIGTLLAYTFVAASIIVLRFQQQKGDVPAPAPSSRPNPEPREGPSGGELKEYESFSDKLQLVDRDKSKEQREPGQLKAAFEPYLEFLSDFYPGEVITVAVVTLMVSAICLCSILVFGSTHLHLPTWSYSLLLVLFSLGFLLSLLLIWAHEQQHSTQTFQVCPGPRQGIPLQWGGEVGAAVMVPQGFQTQPFVESATTAEGRGGRGGGRRCLWTLGVRSVGASAVTLCDCWSPGRDILSSSVSIPWDVSPSYGTQGLLMSTLGSLLCITTIPLLLSCLSFLLWLPFSYVMELIFPNHFYASCASPLLFTAHLSPDVVSAAS